MTMDNLAQEIAALVERYGENALKTTMRTLNDTKSAKMMKLQTGLAKVLEDTGSISFKKFKKEAHEAWKRANPEGDKEREKKPVRGYQLFVQENIHTVRADHPDLKHSECMAIVGRMWKENKPAAAPEESPAEEDTPQPVVRPTKRTPKKGVQV